MNRDALLPQPRPFPTRPHLAATLQLALTLALTLALLARAPFNLQAAHISEPDTVIYGRVVERVGSREFTLSSGELVWKLPTTGPGGRDLSLTTRLERLADGRYSYRLRLPHERLACVLSVKSNAVAPDLAPAVGLAFHRRRALRAPLPPCLVPLRPEPRGAGAVDALAGRDRRRAPLVEGQPPYPHPVVRRG